jgi:hypothetical protein
MDSGSLLRSLIGSADSVIRTWRECGSFPGVTRIGISTEDIVNEDDEPMGQYARTNTENTSTSTGVFRVELSYTADTESETAMNKVMDSIVNITMGVRDDIRIMALNSDTVMHQAQLISSFQMFREFFTFDVKGVSSKRNQTTVFFKVAWDMEKGNPMTLIPRNAKMLTYLKEFKLYLSPHRLSLTTVCSIGFLFLKPPNDTNLRSFPTNSITQ